MWASPPTIGWLYGWLYPLHVLGSTGVDPDAISAVNKQRHLNNCARFQSSILGGTSGSIALNARLSLSYFQFYKVGKFQTDNLVLEKQHLDLHIF